MEKMSVDIFNIKCNKCPIHCIEDHTILLAENIKLKEENEKLKEQIVSLQLDQKEIQLIHNMVITNNLAEIDQCELILKNQALRKINENLMLAINEFKSEIKSLKIDHEKIIRNMAKRLYKIAPIAFKSVIEKMLSNVENQTSEEEIEYLKLLKQYFSSFVHEYGSNSIEPDCDEMNEWIEAMFNKNETIDQEYRYKNSKKIKITLKKSVLDKIVKICEDNQQQETETAK